jgi:hypothetical protein
MGDKLYFASNSRLAVVDVDGGQPKSITDSFDENPGLLEWKRNGIYFSGLNKTGFAPVSCRSNECEGRSRFGTR